MLLRRGPAAAAQVETWVVAATTQLWLVILLLQVVLIAEVVASWERVVLRLILLHEVKGGRDRQVLALFEDHLPGDNFLRRWNYRVVCSDTLNVGVPVIWPIGEWVLRNVALSWLTLHILRARQLEVALFHWNTLDRSKWMELIRNGCSIKTKEGGWINYLPNIRSLGHCYNRLGSGRVLLKSHLSDPCRDRRGLEVIEAGRLILWDECWGRVVFVFEGAQGVEADLSWTVWVELRLLLQIGLCLFHSI